MSYFNLSNRLGFRITVQLTSAVSMNKLIDLKKNRISTLKVSVRVQVRPNKFRLKNSLKI